MNLKDSPQVVVLAGINGAGKTTASRSLLADELSLMTFVNADVIAKGLNGFDPESVAMQAGRVMIDRLHELAATKSDFALETTLAARSYVGWFKELIASGYEVHLFYFWLKSADLAVSRVADRVKSGGHDIPEETIRRRYSRSVRNLVELFIPVVSTWWVYDNSGDFPLPIADGSQGRINSIVNLQSWELFQRS